MNKLENTFMEMCFLIAKLSHCKRHKVGSIIVKDMMILSYGYNGTLAGLDNKCECENGETNELVVHAECNAILKASKLGISVNNSTLYCTLSPCKECAKMIIQAGIKKVYYRDAYRDDLGLEILRLTGVEYAQV